MSSITDVSPYRLDLARRSGVTLPSTSTEGRWPTRCASWTWEGFDVGLEMSGKPAALRDDARHHDPRRQASRCSGLPTQEFGIDWAHLVTNMITIKGIYGRQMFETWYEMSVLLAVGPGHLAGDHAPLPGRRLRGAFETVRSGAVRQGGPRPGTRGP